MIAWPHDLTTLLSLYRAYDSVNPSGAPTAEMILRADSRARVVGILPSSFNPPTNAHTGLAEAAKSYLELDEVVLSLGKVIVDKARASGLTPADRLLLLCALSQHRKDISIAVPSCGLYVDMAKAYRRVYGESTELFFIVGFDKIEQILDPKYYEDRDASLKELFSMANIAVASRGEHGESDLRALLQRKQNQRFQGCVVHLPVNPKLSEISSTNVRQMAHDKKFTIKDVPREVAMFLRETFAYQDPYPFQGEQLDLYQLRAALVARAATSPLAGGDLSPLFAKLCERSEAGAARRKLLHNDASWEELYPRLL